MHLAWRRQPAHPCPPGARGLLGTSAGVGETSLTPREAAVHPLGLEKEAPGEESGLLGPHLPPG